MAESRLRAELRREQNERRSERRERTLLSRRGVRGEWDPVPLTEMPKLAEGLKKKAAVDEALLSRLHKALLQGKEWTDAFLASPGALTALIGHLSGKKENLALHAAFCLCNLTVHTEALNWRLTKAVTPYLMLHLDGASSQMQETCVWTVGHLAVVDEQSFLILQQSCALQKLSKLLQHPSDITIQAAVYSLTHIAQKLVHSLSADELNVVSENLTEKTVQLCDCSRLLFGLSATGLCDQELSQVTIAVVRKMSVLVTGDLQSLDVFSELNFFIRFLANLSFGEHAAVVVAALIAHPGVLPKLVPIMRKEVCWLLCNLLKHADQQVRESAAQFMH